MRKKSDTSVLKTLGPKAARLVTSLHERSHLSHGTAMEIHHMVTQPRLVVYVSTPRLVRGRTIGGTEFRFVRCRRRHLFGVAPHWVTKQETIQVSTSSAR